MTNNWMALQTDTVALQRTARDPAWAVLTSPEYIRHTTTLVSATDDLLDAAKRRDLEATPLAYVSLTLSCVQCHRYIARMRIARASAVFPFEGRASIAGGMMGRRLSQPLAWTIVMVTLTMAAPPLAAGVLLLEEESRVV